MTPLQVEMNEDNADVTKEVAVLERTDVRRRILIVGAALATLGVAFGAHALRDTLGAQRLGWWNTAVQYQMWHAVALVALAGAIPRAVLPAVLLASGTLLFSGSLYGMALFGARWLGPVTPVGGLLMIAGWAVVAWRCVGTLRGTGSLA